MTKTALMLLLSITSGEDRAHCSNIELVCEAQAPSPSHVCRLWTQQDRAHCSPATMSCEFFSLWGWTGGLDGDNGIVMSGGVVGVYSATRRACGQYPIPSMHSCRESIHALASLCSDRPGLVVGDGVVFAMCLSTDPKGCP